MVTALPLSNRRDSRATRLKDGAIAFLAINADAARTPDQTVALEQHGMQRGVERQVSNGRTGSGGVSVSRTFGPT